MNFVKSFLSPSKTTSSNESQSQITQEEELGIVHLNKVFSNYKNKKHPLDPVLPLFCKAFKSARANEINEKFPEIADFAKCVSEELVESMTLSASNKSLEDGSVALFNLIKGKQWNNVCAVNIASLSNSAVKSMCLQNLPSTFVKMLYLFMDLPLSVAEENTKKSISKMMMSVLIRFGEHVCVVEELKVQESQDLLTLFDICTSWWPPYNKMWQACAVQFLQKICRQSLTQGIVDYLDKEDSMKNCIHNLQFMIDDNVLGVADTMLSLFGCLKDSCNVSPKLLDNFNNKGGYRLLTKAIVKLDALQGEELQKVRTESLNKLIYSVRELSTCGFDQIIPEIHAKCMQFQSKDFCIPTPSGKGSVKNSAVFSVLVDSFLQSETEFTHLLILDVMNNIYRMDEVNYFILSKHDALNFFIQKCLMKRSSLVQERILKMLEHVVFVLRYVPSSELGNLCIMLRDSPPGPLAVLILATLNKLISADARLKEVFLQLELINSLQFCQIQFLHLSQEDKEIDENYLQMLMTTLTTMLENCYPCYTTYVELPARDYLYDMLHVGVFRSYVLHVIKILSTYECDNDEHDDIRCLLDVIQDNPTDTNLKLDILRSLSELFVSLPIAQFRFQRADGFLKISQLIVSAEEFDKEEHIRVIGAVLNLLQSALHNNPANQHYFYTRIKYSSLTESLRLLPCFSPCIAVPHQQEVVLEVVRYLMKLALDPAEELVPQQHRSEDSSLGRLTADMEYYNQHIAHPDVLLCILELVHDTQSDDILNTACEWIMQLTLDQHNLELLCTVSFISYMLELFPHVFNCPTNPCHVRLVSLFEVLARHRLTPQQLRTFLRLDNPLYCKRPEQITDKLDVVNTYPILQGDTVDIENGELISTLSTTDTEIITTEPISLETEISSEETSNIPNTKSEEHRTSDSLQLDSEIELVSENQIDTSELLDALEDEVYTDENLKTRQSDTEPPDSESRDSESRDSDEENVAKVKFEEIDTISRLEEEEDEDEKTAPVIISVEEIERLKTELAINFSGMSEESHAEFPEQKEKKEEDNKEEEDLWNTEPQFQVQTILKHHIELMVSISTPIDGDEECAAFLRICEGALDMGYMVPYLIKPNSLGTDKMFQSSYSLLVWYQIPKVDQHKAWEINVIHHKNLKINLLPGMINIATNEVMQTHEAKSSKDDNSWHLLHVALTKGAKIRSSAADFSIDNERKTAIKIDFPLLLDSGPLAFGMIPGQKSLTTWKLGPVYLYDGSLGSADLDVLFMAGPGYMGNFRDRESNMHPPILNISPKHHTTMMLEDIAAEIQDTEVNKWLNSQESVGKDTPFKILPNLSAHLVTYMTPPCAIALYNSQCISPIDIGVTFSAIGSSHVMLGLVAMVSDSEGLYAAIKLLTLVVNNNQQLQQAMEDGGYEVLALLIHRKCHIASTHVLQLVSSLGATNGLIKHPTAVRHLLGCFEIWRNASTEIQTQLFTCIYNLAIIPQNLDLLNEMDLPRKLLEFIFDTSVDWTLIQSALDVMSAVLSTCSQSVLKTFGNYLVYTLPSSLVNEHVTKEIPHVIKVRNMLLELLCVLVQSSDMNNDSKLRLEIEETVGFDWVLLFLRPGLNHITFTMALRLTAILISPSNGFIRFSQKLNHGGWIMSSGTNTMTQRQDSSDSTLHGFPLLLHILKGHTRIPEFHNYSSKLYTWLISLMLHQPTSPNSLSGEFNLSSLTKTFSDKACTIINKDPLVVLVSVIKDDLEDGYFSTVLRYLTQLYITKPAVQTVFISIIETIIGLLCSPDLEPTKDLILRRPAVLDLLRHIILTELFKQNYDILDVVLEPNVVEFEEALTDYQNVMIHHVLKEVEKGAPDEVSSKNFNKAAIFFSKFILHKLWEGKLGNSTNLLTGLLNLAEWISEDAELQIMSCLRRALLYYLSQSASTTETHKMILKVIHMISEKRKTIFPANMSDYEFVICLSHLLRSLPSEGEWGKLLEEASNSLFYTLKDLRPDLEIYLEPTSEIPLHCVSRTSRSTLSSIFTASEDTQIVIQHEIAPKLFAQIKLQQEEGDKVLHTQRSSRRFTGLLTARRQESQLTLPVVTALNMTHELNYAQTTNIMCFISDRIKESVHNTQLQFHRIHTKWNDIQLQLTRERGLWGPAEPSHLNRWMLDHVEGPHRTRKRLKLNDNFYTRFQPKSVEEYRLSKFKQPSSAFSKEYYYYYGTRDRVSSLASIGGASEISQTISARTLDADNRLMMDLLLPGEQKIHAFPCLRVQGLETVASLLFLGRRSAYIIDGYTLTMRDDIMDVQMLMPEEWCKRFSDILVDHNALITKQRAAHHLNYKGITEIVKRRYSLQENGMEIFSKGGESYFLVFGSNQRNKAYHKLKYLTPSLTPKSDFASDVLSSARRHTRDTGSVFSNFRQSNVTQRWVVGEITNFQYLMYINTLAGRSYNDLMQYPIFPWILADYDSPELNLGNPATFRDLSKPMGAQTPDRLSQFQKRYADWVDPHGTDTNPCHYGTFYSSAMITSSYLIRQEPFTSSFIELQGGHFDLADRLFHSIKDAWKSASEINMCDVRELIPEFFYLPEFLVNRNMYDFGKKQNGVKIDDVLLPVWAKGDPAEFIRVHREALESDYVSSQLHHWIDLIFGYKQRGIAAQKACNTFHCYFYEGNIDLSSLNDPLRKSAVKGFINNFGQAPKQIFTRPHPVRSARYSDMVQKTFHYNVVNLKPPLKEETVISSPVQQIESTEHGGLLFAGKNKVLVPCSSGYNYYFTWGLPDNSILLGAVDGKILKVYENLDNQIITCMLCPDSELVVTGGEYSYISVWSHNLSKTKDTALTLKKQLFGHNEAISCLSSSDNHRVLVSGSKDKTVIVWDINKLCFIRQLPKHPHRITAVSINDISGEIITSACNCLLIWSINGVLLAQTQLGNSPSLVIQVVTDTSQYEWDRNNVIVTGSTDGIVRIWGVLHQKAHHGLSRETLNKVWVRKLVIRSKLSIHTSFLRSDNKNPAEITCLRFSEDHINLYVGDSKGRVYCWTNNESKGKHADHWVQDSGVKKCKKCEIRFTFVERRHHCRQCGGVFCNGCSSFYKPIPVQNITHKVRVCGECFERL